MFLPFLYFSSSILTKKQTRYKPIFSKKIVFLLENTPFFDYNFLINSGNVANIMTANNDQIIKGEVIRIQYGSTFDYMTKELVALKDFSMQDALEKMVISNTKTSDGYEISNGLTFSKSVSITTLIEAYKECYSYDMADCMRHFLINNEYATPLEYKTFEFGD